MTENDAEIMDNTNGNQEDEFSALTPPVMIHKSLFGNSASRLREAQRDEMAEKTKELNDSKNSGSLGEQAADESSSFDKEGSPAPEDEPMPQQNDHSMEESASAIEKDEESNAAEEIDDGEESDDEAEETSTAEEPKSLADELGELQNDKVAEEDDVEKESTGEQVDESDDSALVEEKELVNEDETKADSPKPVIDDDDDDDEEEEEEDKMEEQGEEQKVAIKETPKTPKVEAASSARSSARRSTRQKDDSKPVEETTPLTSTKRASRGRGAAAAETPKTTEKATPVPKTARRSAKKEKDETETEVEEAKIEPLTETPKRGKKAEPTPKKEKQEEAEETPSRTLRKRASTLPEKAETPRNTPRGKKASRTPATAKTEKEEPGEEAEEKIAEPKSQQRTPRSRKSVATTSKTESAKKDKEQDPFDFDEMADKHPEPLKNIQVEVQNFGAVRFSKVGSGKYSNTEKAAEGRVGISTPTPEKSSTTRVSLMDLSRKEAELATQATPRSAPSRRKKVDDEEEMDYEISTQKAALSKSAPAPKGRKRRSSPATVTPKKPKVEVPILSKAEQIAVDWRNDDLDRGVLPGARVYALYDKVFYPAIVISVSGFGRIQVQFVQDQLTKELPESAVIPVVQLSNERLAVVQTEKADVRVVVVDPPTKETLFECVFHLRSIDDGPNEAPKDYHMSWDKLILDHDDWTDYIKLKDTQATEVKTANIEDGKTKLTRSARHNSASTTPVVAKSKAPAKAKTPKTEATPKVETSTKPAKEAVKEKTGNSKFFSGYAFLLTSANRPAPDNQIPFKKNELKQRIQQRGGKIIESVTETTEAMPILISDTYYRTMKYLAALASDVPCVSHEWVHECVKQETFLDFGDYHLQAGASIVDEKIHACKKLKGQLLKGKRVCIYSLQEKAGPNLTFSEIWQPIVVSLGAEVVKYSDADGNLDYFITDPSCHVDTAKEAMDQGALVLSSEWLIQTIIMGEPQHPDAHARFAYNYSGNQ
ncbi:unnamed protein product, partial [Mesorhabditis belari]|uniref:BRCT domain-containing protein n=1 Tax=Mesorhabditis belari TaxID=2138241 RepID=A0AAF3F207_9BILA